MDKDSSQHKPMKKDRDNRDGKSPAKAGKGGKVQVDGTSHKVVGTLLESAEYAPTALDRGDPNYASPVSSPRKPPAPPREFPEVNTDTKLKLIYFDLPGKGEGIRLAAAVGGVNMEDCRITRDEFMAMKQSGELPYGQVPALKVGKITIAQSAAIIRLIGKLGGSYPTNPVHAAVVDSIVAQENDMFTGVSCVRYQDRFGFDGALGGAGAANTLKVEKALNDTILPKHLAFFEQLLQDSETIWIAGTEGPSIADFVLVPRLQWIASGVSGVSKDILESYPGILALIDNTMKLPAVQAFYKK